MIRIAILRPGTSMCEFKEIERSEAEGILGGFFEKIVLDEDSCMLYRQDAGRLDLPVNDEAVKLHLLAKEELFVVQGTVIIAGTLNSDSVYDGELHDLDPTMEHFLGHLTQIEVLVA